MCTTSLRDWIIDDAFLLAVAAVIASLGTLASCETPMACAGVWDAQPGDTERRAHRKDEQER